MNQVGFDPLGGASSCCRSHATAIAIVLRHERRAIIDIVDRAMETCYLNSIDLRNITEVNHEPQMLRDLSA
jgi:hypothetical protein